MCVDFVQYEISKTSLLMAALKFSFEDLPQFIIQVVFMMSTDCGKNNQSLIVHLSILTSLLSSYCGFLFKLAHYLYEHKRLHAYVRKVQVVIDEAAIETYGFRHLKKMLRLTTDVQSFSLVGSKTEYLTCSVNRLRKIQSLVSAVPVNEQLEFFELNRCAFQASNEAARLFEKILLKNNME